MVDDAGGGWEGDMCGGEAQKKVPVFRVRVLNPSATSDLTLQHVTVTDYMGD
jgi:hypothetical protein